MKKYFFRRGDGTLMTGTNPRFLDFPEEKVNVMEG
jgi:hypothetical protein